MYQSDWVLLVLNKSNRINTTWNLLLKFCYFVVTRKLLSVVTGSLKCPQTGETFWKLVASHDPIVHHRLNDGPKNAAYTSPDIQNSLFLMWWVILCKMRFCLTVNPLTTNDTFGVVQFWPHVIQMVESVLKIGSVLAEKEEQGEVGGCTTLTDSAWRWL